MDRNATAAWTFAAVVVRSEMRVDEGASADGENLWQDASSAEGVVEFGNSIR
jgi:hypothetical protein